MAIAVPLSKADKLALALCKMIMRVDAAATGDMPVVLETDQDAQAVVLNAIENGNPVVFIERPEFTLVEDSRTPLYDCEYRISILVRRTANVDLSAITESVINKIHNQPPLEEFAKGLRFIVRHIEYGNVTEDLARITLTAAIRALLMEPRQN